MLPATTFSLPNFFTPRRRPAESRPFLLVFGPLGGGLLGRCLLGRCLVGSFRLRSSRLRSSRLLVGVSLRSRFLLRSRLLFGLRIANRRDAQQRHLLAVAVLAAIVVAATLLENEDLLALGLRNDLRRNGHLAGIRKLLTFACKQDVTQRDGVAGFSSQLLNRDLVSGGNPVLLAARAHYCEHGGYLSFKLLCRDLANARRTRQAARSSPGKKRAVKR